MDEEFSPEERVLLQRNYAVKWPAEKKKRVQVQKIRADGFTSEIEQQKFKPC